MTTGYGFNWTWIEDKENTKRASGVVYQGGGTVFSFRQAASGVISSADLNAFARSTSQNLQNIRSDWRTYIHPILNSLPGGGNDLRWSTELGKGLPEKIDCFTYGVQGSTLFVFNDSDDTKADGRYWHDEQYRPKTIAEAFEDVYESLYNIETGLSDPETDLDPLWASIGEEYRDDVFRTATGSLHSRVTLLNTYIQQLNNDIYEPTSFPYGIGTPIPYSIANMLDEILKIHQVTGGWGEDPSGVGHGTLTPASHNHSFDEILPPPAASLTQARVGPFTSLENEILRLRYEIQLTRGSASWYSDVIDPVTSSAGSLGTHIDYTGSGSVTSGNPHGVSMNDIGAIPYFDAIVSFTGMTNYVDSNPTYTSINYVTQNVSLETAIGELDSALEVVATSANVVRLDRSYDRSYQSETLRANSPIIVEHNIGRKPIVEVLDVSPTFEDYYGQYSSPAVDLNIVHINENSFEIWTEASVVEVIIIG